MRSRGNFLQRLADGADLSEENITAQPLLEVCGDRRVVIERHEGVTEYTRDRITVRVKGGEYCVMGQELSLCRMCDQHLLIRGKIDSIQVRKGRG